MEIMRLQEEDFERAIKLSEYAFQYDVPPDQIEKRKEMLRKHHILGIWEREDLAAKLHILPLKVWIGSKEWEMGGIAGVATYPEYRRQGHVRELIGEALREMKGRGQSISFLHPFDIGFYRRFGWEIISDYKKVTIEKGSLRMIKRAGGGSIKRLTKASHNHDIEAVYDQYAQRYSCMLVRSRDWWLDHVYHDLTAAVYYDEHEEPKGYVLYKLKNNLLNIHEYVAVDHIARIQLWNFICQHDSMVDKVEVTTSVYDPLPFFLGQPKQKVELSPYFMGRVVDAKSFLNKYPFLETNQQVFLHVSDEAAPWNTGTYLIADGEVEFFGPKAGSQCTDPPQKGLRLTINSLSALLLGYRKLEELAGMGEILGPESDIQALSRKLPSFSSFFYDFF
ncbi:GNAT family N-acetyltransferase [Bacillus sp. FJAT-27251]|uniref:GNAT family N-acetyltransferase n=1 Tax=Bacillus sp. FJAT-27251 TaxID=1684142 RepID=UPI0006A7F127|nr:GNAT family N-acetyltransferase [Bacillus sp. FJAT-27251]